MNRRVVEGWLTNANELSFTIPFGQLLVSQGKRVVHISSQGPMEQGKDVIAVDTRGRVHCYQLKCGNINARVWGAIKSEIDQLVELPPRHPSIPRNVSRWNAYLVTNGRIANPTARDISDYAEVKHSKGFAKLQTITGTELVSEFTRFYGAHMPVEVSDMHRFLGIYNQNGDYNLDLGQLKVFFEALFDGSSGWSEQRKVELVRASLILCSYLLTHKHARSNHLEIVKAWILLLASIYRFADTSGLKPRSWRDTEALVWESIETEFRQLIDELTAHPEDFLQTEYGIASEVLVLQVRCTELLGYLSAYVNYCVARGREPYRMGDASGLLERLSSQATLLGEATTPFFINHAVSFVARASRQEAVSETTALLLSVLQWHQEGGRGLPSPYYNVTDVVEWLFGLDSKRIRETFQGRSYCLRSIVMMLARMEQREPIRVLWNPISHIDQQEMVPGDKRDYLLWRTEGGTLDDRFPSMEQSWGALVAEAKADYSVDLPDVLRGREYFLPFLINVMPHRCNHRFVLLMLETIESAVVR